VDLVNDQNVGKNRWLRCFFWCTFVVWICAQVYLSVSKAAVPLIVLFIVFPPLFQFLSKNGIYEFWNWFDDRTWYDFQ
jgi:hypothetical protein